jgi:hypothetical protein
MKPICVPCERFYRPKKNGTAFIEGMPNADDARPGKDHRLEWSDYKLWHGDKWACPGCGHEIIVGVAKEPLSEHYLPDFEKMVESFKPIFRVNDC